MGNTVYASFADPSLAEKAAGALLDHGVRSEDLSIVTSHSETSGSEINTSRGVSSHGDNDNDVKNAADAGMGYTAAAGDKVQEFGARTMAGINDALGNESGEAKWEAEANRQNQSAHQNVNAAGNQASNAVDQPGTGGGSSTSSYTAPRDGENDVKNAGDSAMGVAAGVGDKVQEFGARTMAGVNDALGNESGEAKWQAEANRQNQSAQQNFGAAGNEARDAVDMNSSRSTDVEDSTEAAAKHGISTTTAADAGAGAVKGAGWGLGLGAVAALASLMIPGVGLVVGGGALAAALGGVAAATGAGAAAGAVTGYLKDQGVDTHVAEDYDRTVQGGGAILAVTTPSGNVSKEQIMETLTKYGASNLNAYDAQTTGGGYVA